MAEYVQHVRVRREVYVPKPEMRKVAEVLIGEPLKPKPLPTVVPAKPKPIPSAKKVSKKKLTAPPPSSALGSPKNLPQKEGNAKQLVARKGLLGLLSKKTGDTSPRAYQPSKKRDVSDELKTALKDLSGPKTDDDGNDFLGVGNLPEVAKRGTDIGYVLDAAKIGEISETQVEFHGGVVEELPEQIEEEIEVGKGGRTTSDIRKVVASYLGGLRYLYNKELRKDPSLRGKIVVRFEISPAGRVTQTDLLNSTIGSPTLDQAILGNIRKWKFPGIPEKNGSVTVTYPFVFLPPTS
jgi:TonB family protein